MIRTSFAAVALVASLATGLRAQSWRTVEISRQLLDTTAYKVLVEYGAGRFELEATNDPVLYAMRLRYDDERTKPLHDYDAGNHALRLGIDGGRTTSITRGMRGDEHGEMQLGLARGVPLELYLQFGATESRLDVGGLSLRDLHVATGASHTTVVFSEPNPEPLRAIEVEVGAAGVEMRRLANANTGSIRVKGGVGGITLDFDGEWTRDIDVETDVPLGKVTLRVPDDVGVRLEVSRFLAAVDTPGLRRKGDAWVSENWEQAAHHVRIRARTTLGAISVERTAH